MTAPATFTPRPGVSVTRTVKRVTTFRAGVGVVQNHHGHKGVIRVPGEREVVYCCGFHQKAKAARQHAEKTARWIVTAEGQQWLADGRPRR